MRLSTILQVTVTAEAALAQDTMPLRGDTHPHTIPITSSVSLSRRVMAASHGFFVVHGHSHHLDGTAA